MTKQASLWLLSLSPNCISWTSLSPNQSSRVPQSHWDILLPYVFIYLCSTFRLCSLCSKKVFNCFMSVARTWDWQSSQTILENCEWRSQSHARRLLKTEKRALLLLCCSGKECHGSLSWPWKLSFLWHDWDVLSLLFPGLMCHWSLSSCGRTDCISPATQIAPQFSWNQSQTTVYLHDSTLISWHNALANLWCKNICQPSWVLLIKDTHVLQYNAGLVVNRRSYSALSHQLSVAADRCDGHTYSNLRGE